MRSGLWRSQFWQWDDFMSFENDMADFSFISGHRDPRLTSSFDVVDTARREDPVQVAAVESMVAAVVDAPAAVEFLTLAAMDPESFVVPAPTGSFTERMTSTYRGLEIFAPDASLIEPNARFAASALEGGDLDPVVVIAEPQASPPDWLLLG